MSILDDAPPLTECDDLLRPDVLANPYPVYARLRSEDPVHWNEPLEAWMLLRYGDILSALTDHGRLSSDRTDAFMAHLSPEERERVRFFAETRRRMMLYTDPPRHTQLRGLVNRGMTPGVVKRMRPHVETVIDDLLDAVEGRGHMDAIHDVGYPFPVIVNAHLIGIPPEDRDILKSWTSDFIAAISGGGAGVPLSVLERGQAAVQAMKSYFDELAEERRKRPRDDLLTAVATGHGDVEGTGPDDVYATCIVVLFAGFETALNLIGNGLLALLRHPDQLRLLRERPNLVSTAVEELLRYDSPLQLVGRRATEDFEIGGKRIHKDDKVLVMLGSANHDPEEFDDPDVLDVARTPNKHVGFSHGIHYCPGSSLSRVAGEIAFSKILARFPRLRLEGDDLEWQRNLSFRGLVRLPVAFS